MRRLDFHEPGGWARPEKYASNSSGSMLTDSADIVSMKESAQHCKHLGEIN